MSPRVGHVHITVARGPYPPRDHEQNGQAYCARARGFLSHAPLTHSSILFWRRSRLSASSRIPTLKPAKESDNAHYLDRGPPRPSTKTGASAGRSSLIAAGPSVNPETTKRIFGKASSGATETWKSLEKAWRERKLLRAAGWSSGDWNVALNRKADPSAKPPSLLSPA